LIWFKGIKWVKPTLVVGKSYLVYGKANQFGSKWNIAHPDLDLVDAVKIIPGMLQPIYHSGEKLTSKGLNTRGFEKVISNLLAVSKGKISESLTPEIVNKLNLLDRDTAYQDIHRPINSSVLKRALLRLKFEELFFLQLAINKHKINAQRKSKGYVFSKIGAFFNQFYNSYLPFELTNAQKRVVKEIRKDLGSGLHMNRLLQGDVGSGKTLVAVLNMLIAIDNGFQSCLMAPTEILATQHFNTINELLNEMGVTVKLLTGSSKKKERTIIHQELNNGTLSILIGTHAVLEDVVEFNNLGLAIIDEQHRFGVAQRSKLWKKNTFPPHILVMTATPIP
jgi:ATP-dependent DNA helicase RecG